MNFSGIRTQLTIGIALTTLAGIGLIGFLSIRIIETSAVYWKISEAGKISRFAGAVLNAPSSDPSANLRLAAAALKGAGVYDFRLTDASGRELMKEGSPPDGQGTLIPSSADGLKVRRIGGGWLKGPGSSLHITSRLESGAAFTLEFAVGLREIKEEMAGVRRFLLIYALLDSAVIIAFVVYFLSRSIISPIRELEEAATRISGGKLYERAQVTVDNEIGSLANSFNTMAERLEIEIKSLERVNLELVNAQEELLRSSTLAAVGRLAAGIAHEIGNPLGAVRGYVDILSKGADDREERKEILKRVEKDVSRIDSIVREFLEIARPSKKPARPVDVNGLVEETLASVSAHRDFAGVQANKALAAGLPPVIIDEDKLGQVFFNILINAAHAMDGMRTKSVSIETGVERRPAEKPRQRRRRDDPVMDVPLEVLAQKEFVFIRFRDAGPGIGEEDSKKVFDPFFTTKDVGRGSGLGLFVSQGIIKTYGGEINLETAPGKGSVFTVTLPSGGKHEYTDN